MPTPTQTLPEIVAITGMRDFGPSDGEGSCPHCGCRGRYVWYFICADGSQRGAMRGCIQLFPGSNSCYAKLIQEAYERQVRIVAARPHLFPPPFFASALSISNSFRLTSPISFSRTMNRYSPASLIPLSSHPG